MTGPTNSYPADRPADRPLMVGRWPKPVGRDTVELNPEPDESTSPHVSDSTWDHDCPVVPAPESTAGERLSDRLHDELEFVPATPENILAAIAENEAAFDALDAMRRAARENGFDA